MAFTDRIAGPVRRAFSGRPASLSLAEATPDKSERGVSGVSYAAGRSIDQEYKYELRGAQGGKTYRRMRWSDPHIDGLRSAQNLPMLQAEAKILPAEAGDADSEAKAALVERLLLRDFPWRSFLQDTFLALDYGFSCFEIVWRVEDGEARCRLALRPTSSIAPEDIHVVNGAIDHVVQHPASGGEYTIPGEKLVWFAHNKEGDSFQGRPVLRSMYKPWKIKEELEIELPILVRKLGGVPDIATEDEPTPEDAKKLDEAGAAFGLSPEAYFRHTSDVTVSLLTGSANVKDVLDAIQQRNYEITSACNAQVLDLGVSQAGSRALGSTLSDMFANGVQALAKAREDVLNAKGGLIHQLVAYNFPRDDNLPRLKFGNVQAVDLLRFAQALVNLKGAFGLAALDPETEEWARSEIGAPLTTTTQTVMPEKAEPPVPASSKSQGPGADATGGSAPESGAKASESGHGHALRLAERRAPRGVECYVALAEVDARFDDARTAVRESTQRTRDRLVSLLAERAQAAQAAGKLEQFAATQPPMVDALRNDVKAVLSEFYAAGRTQVAEELQRQRDGEPVAEEAIDARREGQRVMAAERPRKKLPPPPAPEEAIEQAAEVTARILAAETQAAVAAAVARTAAGVPIEQSAVIEAAARASDASALRMVGVVADIMQLGRASEAQAQASDIADAVYSAILDGAVCEECEPMDGETTTDLDEAAGWTPNPSCLGGDRCRCLTVYEYKQEAP